jgi:hypothetical protein
LTTTTTINPQNVTEDAYAGHPFDKKAAISFVKKSCFDSWLKSVCVARFEDPETYDHPRVLMMILGDYLEVSLKAAKGRNDYQKICALCKMGFQMKQELFLKDEIMQCDETCEYFEFGFGVKE